MRALVLAALAWLALAQYCVANHDEVPVLTFHCQDPSTCVDGYHDDGPSFVTVIVSVGLPECSAFGVSFIIEFSYLLQRYMLCGGLERRHNILGL